MSLILLRELSETPLPCTKGDPAMIDRLRLLEAAGLVKVLIPPVHVDCDHCQRQDPATVLEITSRGWEALRTNRVVEDAPLPPPRQERPRSGSAALNFAQLAAWLSSFRRRPGRATCDHPDAPGRADTDG